MLIVVAIIAVLVAIAIPTFNGALNKAEEATDKANIRAAYAENQVKEMDPSLVGTAGKVEGNVITFADGSTYTLKTYGGVDKTKDPWVGTEKAAG